jgi:hypothetical protein
MCFILTHLIACSFHNAQAAVLETTQFIHILARIAMADPKVFFNLMSATATPRTTEEGMLEELMEVWFARVSFSDSCSVVKIQCTDESSLITCTNLVTVN